MNPRNGVVTVLLTIAALGSWYLARMDQGNNADEQAQEATERGYYLKSARILGTGADGKLLYEIFAEHAEQRDDVHIEFTDVLVNYSPDSDVPWTVKADAATIDKRQRNVMLSGHVLATSTEGFSGNDTEIRTDFLDLDPENYIAETNGRVQIRIGARSLTATGMLASLKENQLELRSNVSGKFLP